MSAPTFVAAGSTVQSVGSVAVPWPAGHQADDIGILYVQTSNETVPTPSGWTVCPSSPQGAGTPGAAGSAGVSAFWKRATSAAEADVTVADAGNHVKCRIVAFRGCETSGSPFHTSAGGSLATASAAVSIPGVVTTVDECYILAAVANGTDINGNQTTFDAFSNASLSDLVRLFSSNTTTGNGGGCDVAGGVKTVAGSVGATTVTLANASLQGLLTLALMPPQGSPPPPDVENGGIWVGTGIKATAGVVSATTATFDTASAQARLLIALKPPAAPPVNQPPVIETISDKPGASVGTNLSFPINVTDPEGDPLTVTLQPGSTSVPAGATVIEDPEDGSFAFDWTPAAGEAGEWNIIVRATDGTNTTEQAFNIIVAGTPPSNLLTVARDITLRAQADLEAAEALTQLVLDQEQMNATVLHATRTLTADLAESAAYMVEALAELEAEGEL